MNSKIAKRMLSVVLVVLQVVLLTIPASASSASNVGAEKTIQENLKHQFRYDSNYEGVMEDANGNYALVVEVPDQPSSVLLPAGYLQVDLLDPASVDEVLNHPNLSAEIKAAISDMSQAAKPCVDCDTCNLVSIFSPDLLPETRSLTTSYYTYDGTRMKVDQIQRDAHTEYADIVVNRGSTFTNTANAIYNIGLGVAGIFSTTVSVFGIGQTLFDALVNNSTVNVVSTVTNSQVQARVLFNGIARFTYAYIEDWRIGCVSHSANVQEVQIDYILYRNDERKFVGNFRKDVNRTIETESYANHWAVARNNYHSPKVDDYITVTMGSKVFQLNVS